MKKIIYLSCCFIIGCSSQKTTGANTQKAYTPELIIQDNYKPAKDNHPFTIIDASIVKDNLTVVVQYGGGCREHYFKLFSSGAFEKKSPPKIDLFLEHNFNDDFCKKLVLDTLVFEITKARFPEKTRGFKVEIGLDQYKKILSYKY